MLEKIGQKLYRFVSTPDPLVLECISDMLLTKKDLIFYEIGVGIGATTLAVAELLNNKGKIILFSYQDEITKLTHDLNELGFVNIDGNYAATPDHISHIGDL
jgi:predicted O-methyltransferase YrrM